MQAPELNHLTDREKASYADGLKILAARRKTFAPSAQELHAASLREGQAIIKRKLANASKAKTLAAAPARASRLSIDIEAIAIAAGKEAAKEYARSSKPKKDKTALESQRELTRHRIFNRGFVGCKVG
jgi:hypothetical protein